MFRLKFEPSSDRNIEKTIVRKVNCVVIAGKSLVDESIATSIRRHTSQV